MNIVLASSSPRRKQLLQQAGIPFEVVVPQVDESCAAGTPEAVVKKLAYEKAHAVAELPGFEPRLILAADTVVSSDGRILNKPVDEDDAFTMLRMLSGHAHDVYTGVCLTHAGSAKTTAVRTRVFFRELSEREIVEYIKTGEPMDKAGAYGIQGRAALFVERIEGDYCNVVGLPICTVAEMIEKMSLEGIL